MQMKQFSGATVDEVLLKVRAELGEDAVILQTKRVVNGGIGGFFGRQGGFNSRTARHRSRSTGALPRKPA